METTKVLDAKKVDTRPYFFVFWKESKNWSFIARRQKFQRLLPIENWTIGSVKYQACRVAYTHTEAQAFCQKAGNGCLGIMEGPNLFCVFETGQTVAIATVWKPKLTEELEVMVGTKTSLVPVGSDYSAIKSFILEMMGKTEEEVQTEEMEFGSHHKQFIFASLESLAK